MWINGKHFTVWFSTNQVKIMKRLQNKTMILHIKTKRNLKVLQVAPEWTSAPEYQKKDPLSISNCWFKKKKKQENINSRKNLNGPRLEQTFKNSWTVPLFSPSHLCFFSFSAKTGLLKAAPHTWNHRLHTVSKNLQVKIGSFKQNKTHGLKMAQM